MRAVTTGIIAGLIIATANMATASPAPDRKHQAFPSAPTWQEVRARVPDWQTFIRIARCEQPGSGKYGVRWNVMGPRYEGGMGFFHQTWDGWRPRHYPGNAGSATPQQQILVADAVRDDVGISAWGCA